MKLLHLPNLQATTVTATEMDPESVPQGMPLPEFKNKDEYRAWCADSATDHAFYNLVEGLTPGQRVSGTNPPWRIHGLIGEFDAQQAEGWLERVLKAKYPPTWVSESFTPGHVRMIWAFAQPVGWVNETFGQEFYRLAWQTIKPINVGVGFKEDESTKPVQFFEFGRNWRKTGGPVPVSLTEGWMAKCIKKIKWEKEAALVPVDKLREEGEKQFPGRWPGGWDKFEIGARGIRFWEPGADAASVIVVESGCVCFTGDKPFLPWGEIFGQRFVADTNTEAIGRAVSCIWWEPRTSKYWKKFPDATKDPLKNGDLEKHLAREGLSPVVMKGQKFSQIEDAVYAIQQTRRINGVGPWMYRKEDIIFQDGKTYLNDSMIKLTQPVDEPGEWGKGFPVIAEYLELAYRSEQLPYLLGWLAYFYQSCLAGEPARGQAVFIAGEADSGKTFLSAAIMRLLFGDQQEASKFLMGTENFNEVLCGSPVWTIDDAVAAADTHSRNKYSQIVKQHVANDRIICRGMHKAPVTVYWKGRIVVTMNDDEESIRMIPNLDMSNKDKVMLFRAYSVKDQFSWLKTHDGKFPMDPDVQDETPFLAAYLRDLKIQPPVWAGGRWGINPYHHPDLLTMAEDASDTLASEEVIQDWRREHFKLEQTHYYVDTPTELHRIITDNDSTRRAQIRSPKALSQTLTGMIKRGVPWVKRWRTEDARWVAIASPKLSLTELNWFAMTPKLSLTEKHLTDVCHEKGATRQP